MSVKGYFYFFSKYYSEKKVVVFFFFKYLSPFLVLYSDEY